MKAPLVPVLTLAAGFAGGWFLRRPSSPPPVLAAPVTSAPGSAPAAASPADQPTATAAAPAPGKPAPVKEALTKCRELLKNEKSPARATGKVLAFLDAMDAASVDALARELSGSPVIWSDAQSGALLPLVFGKLAELDPGRALDTALKGSDLWTRSVAVDTVTDHIASTSPGSLFSALEKIPPGYIRRNATASAVASLARKDGPAAVALLQKARVPPNDWAWSRMMSAWASSDPSGAAAHLTDLPRQTAIEAASSLTATWTQRDPQAALAWAQTLSDPAMKREAMSAAIGTVARSDMQQAVALASAQPSGERRPLLETIARSFSQNDPAAAMEWARSLADPQERDRCLATVIRSAGFANVDAARAALNLLPAGARRNEALESFGRQIAWADPATASEWALSLKPNEQALVMRNVVSEMASVDVAVAEKLAAALPASGENKWAWQELARAKSLQDPAAALTWAGALDTEQARVSALSAVFEQWGGYSPDKAAAALAGVTNANLRRQAAESLASTWAARSPAEATQWAEGLTGDDRIAALSAVWKASATDDPRAAGQSLAAVAATATGAAAGDNLAASASRIASAWAGQSPSDAAAWALTLPEGKVREQALGSVAGEWARYDPAGVSEWINHLPHDRSRDAAIGQLVGSIASTDPERAFTWAASVENAEKQADVLRTAALAWKAINPDAARAALENANLPENVYSRVQEALR